MGNPTSHGSSSRGQGRSLRFGLIAVAAATAGVWIVPGVRQALAELWFPPSNVEILKRRILHSAEFQKVTHDKTTDEVQKLMQELAVRGLPRLDGDSLRRRARLIGLALSSADEGLCAEYGLRKVSRSDTRLFDLLSISERQQLEEIGLAAVEQALLAVDELPAVRPGDLGNSIQADLPASMRDRLQTNLRHFSDAAPSEVCWTVRTLYALAGGSSGDGSAALARALLAW
jgi:hypothetical protein